MKRYWISQKWMYMTLLVLLLFIFITISCRQGQTEERKIRNTDLYEIDISDCSDELSRFYPVKDIIVHGESKRVHSEFNILPIFNRSTTVQYYVINKSGKIYNVPFGSDNLYFFWDDRGFQGCSYQSYFNGEKILQWETPCNGFNLTLEIKDAGNYIFVGSEIIDENGVYRRFSMINKMFVDEKSIFNYFINFMKENKCKYIYI